jgi:hypothetical protein
MTEIIEISRESYSSMWFGLGFLVGFLLSPIFMWLIKLIKKEVEQNDEVEKMIKKQKEK